MYIFLSVCKEAVRIKIVQLQTIIQLIIFNAYFIAVTFNAYPQHMSVVLWFLLYISTGGREIIGSLNLLNHIFTHLTSATRCCVNIYDNNVAFFYGLFVSFLRCCFRLMCRIGNFHCTPCWWILWLFGLHKCYVGMRLCGIYDHLSNLLTCCYCCCCHLRHLQSFHNCSGHH